MPKSVERCVKKLSLRKEIENAWAVCTAAHNKKKKRKGGKSRGKRG